MIIQTTIFVVVIVVTVYLGRGGATGGVAKATTLMKTSAPVKMLRSLSSQFIKRSFNF